MIPGDPSPGKSRGAGGAACFMALGLLHIALIMGADFSEPPRVPEAPRFVVIELPPPEAAPPAPARVLPREAPVPVLASAPAPEQAQEPAVTEEAAPEELLPVSVPVDATPAGGNPGTAFAGDAGEAVQAGPFRRTGMSGADYAALVMRRLEEKKIYPLSMRKRGIAGDAAVYFSIRPDGSLGSLRAGEGAHPFLVQAALETVRSAVPFPVMEGRGEEYSLSVTIRFQLE